MRRLLLILMCVISVNLFGQEKEIQYLSGMDKNQTVDWDFYCTGGRMSGYWTKIPVPSCWELQGFGNYNYGRDYKTYGKNFRFADEKGLYKHSFEVPASWKDKEIYIVFEGSMTDTKVKINGQSAGPMHQGAFYRFKYNISDKIKHEADNLLEVEVAKMSAEKTVNNAERLADYWVFGGIFRPVYLEAVNREFIDYTGIDAQANGDFSMQVFLKNLSRDAELSAEIIDQGGKVVGRMDGKLKSGDTASVLKTKINHPLLWTSETPHLYKINVYLKRNKQTLYQTTENFGFRTIEIRRGEGIYINGTQVKMKGVNRHSFWPESGRTLSDEILLKDVQLIKDMNMNAVRSSHYPPDSKFLDYCDSLGLYVIDELAGWQTAYSTEAGRPLVREMVIRDLNHPSIIFWANGNEGGTNKNLDADFDQWDYSRRPVIHPHHRPGNEYNGIDCDHYEDYYSTQRKLKDTLIYMPTEFAHSQDDGGAGSGMDDLWELHWESQRSGGGFIWALLDEGVVRTDRNNVLDANGLNGNDGIVGPYRQKEGSFYTLKEIFSSVRIDMKEIPADFDGSVNVENRYHFTNLNENTYRWALINYRKPFDWQFSGHIVEKVGKATCPSIQPLATGKLALNLPANYRDYDAVMLSAIDKSGHEIYKWTWKIKDNAALLKDDWGANSKQIDVKETDSLVILSADGARVVIDKLTGLLKGATNNALGLGHLSFTNGPVQTQGDSKVLSVNIEKNGDNAGVQFLMNGPMKKINWSIQKNGWVKLDYEYELHGSYTYAGVSFDYPENYILSAKWLGRGPYRQWKNRIKGTNVDVWENQYNNTQTSYSPLIYPEFKGYYSDITWMEFNTVEGKFYVASEGDNLSVRLFDFYGLTGAKPFPALPPGDISFLDCIPPMGSKLALNVNRNTRSLGPQSENTDIDSSVRRILYFYFGLPEVMGGSKENYTRPEIDEVF